MYADIPLDQSPCKFSVCISYSTDEGRSFKKIIKDLYVNSLILAPVKKHGRVNDAIQSIYSIKPDALREEIWIMKALDNQRDEWQTELKSNTITNGIISPTIQVLDAISSGIIKPLLNPEIYDEYQVVLTRTKLHLDLTKVNNFLKEMINLGEFILPTSYAEDLPDPKDRIFFEISLTRNSYLVTGNGKHFPKSPKVVSPAQMIMIIYSQNPAIIKD